MVHPAVSHSGAKCPSSHTQHFQTTHDVQLILYVSTKKWMVGFFFFLVASVTVSVCSSSVASFYPTVHGPRKP